MKKTTRKEAIDAGLKHYFTGVPCKYGHMCGRFTSDRHCIQCSSIKAKAWCDANPERLLNNVRNWQRANPERVRGNAKKRHEANPELNRRRAKKYRDTNSELCRMLCQPCNDSKGTKLMSEWIQ